MNNLKVDLRARLPMILSLLMLLMVLSWSVVREFAYTLDDMVHFDAVTTQLGGESHPLLDKLRAQPTLNIDDVLGALPAKREFTAKKRIFVSRHEVTNTQYQVFLNQIKARPASLANFAHSATPQGHQFLPSSLRDIKYNGKQQPVVNLDWHDAYAFCRYINMRLPTADEFEAIFQLEAGLRQPAEFDFPQNNGPQNNGPQNKLSNEEVIPRNVASYQSAKGVFHDIIGNVMEWVQPEQGRHFLMGYSYKQYGDVVEDKEPAFYPWKRTYDKANGFENDYGVRCVYEPTQADFLSKMQLTAPLTSSAGVNCWQTMANLGENAFNLLTNDNKWLSTGGRPFPQELCELPQKRYQLGPDLDLTTGDLIHQHPLGHAFYLLGRSAQDIEVPTFWLDRTEVSVAEYADFVNTFESGKKLYAHPETPKNVDHTPLNWAQQQQNANAAVTGISWWSAFTYCGWQNKRLPFATEWERAANGNDRRIYAWGDDSNVNAQTPDLTPQGVAGMTRSVSEWTASFMLGSDAAVVKGGSDFFDWQIFGRAYVELKLPRNVRSAAVGFRCARG